MKNFWYFYHKQTLVHGLRLSQLSLKLKKNKYIKYQKKLFYLNFENHQPMSHKTLSSAHHKDFSGENKVSETFSTIPYFKNLDKFYYAGGGEAPGQRPGFFCRLAYKKIANP